MRKITVCVLTLAFLVAGAASCAKSTKGRVTNEWNVVSYEKTDNYTGSQGSTNSTKMSMNESSFTLRNVAMTNGVVDMDHTLGGSVNSHVLNIKKDGTWSWTQDVTYLYEDGSSRKLLEETGTWSFVRKTKGDDFKKNERVLFNVLLVDVMETETVNDVIVESNSDKITYSTGKNTMVYTITESKKDKLEMESESNTVVTENSGSHTNSISRKISLESK